VCDELGVSDLDRLRSALARRASRATFLYAFDLLELDGQDLRAHPSDDRRVALARLLRDCPDGLRLSEHLEGSDGATVFAHRHGQIERVAGSRCLRQHSAVRRCSTWQATQPPPA
jgi:bifunctional non-homologous end joining protein LigD